MRVRRGTYLPNIQFRRLLTLAKVCVILNLASSAPSQLHRPQDDFTDVRRYFSNVFLKPDARSRVQAFIKSGRRSEELAELLGLLESVYFLQGGRGDILETLYKIRPGKGAKLRERILLADRMGKEPVDFKTLATTFPYDFVAQERFVFKEIVARGGRSSAVENALQSLEQLTDNHPIAVFLRARKEFYVERGSSGETKSLQLSYAKHKLYHYARSLVGLRPNYSSTIDHILRELKSKGITPPEPTPEQYAAVKKRGWTFNKQMLEPFKKVD